MGLHGSWVGNDPVMQPGLERGCHRGNVIRVALPGLEPDQRRVHNAHGVQRVRSGRGAEIGNTKRRTDRRQDNCVERAVQDR